MNSFNKFPCKHIIIHNSLNMFTIFSHFNLQRWFCIVTAFVLQQLRSIMCHHQINNFHFDFNDFYVFFSFGILLLYIWPHSAAAPHAVSRPRSGQPSQRAEQIKVSKIVFYFTFNNIFAKSLVIIIKCCCWC